jgi:carboxyl-terminal processing protease
MARLLRPDGVRPRTLWALRRLAPVPRFVPLVALVVVVLLLGTWVGGRHSDWLPGPVRDALVGDSDTAVVKEAIDRVHDTYYRQIPKSALADDAIAGVVSKLGDRFSNYFDPAQYKRFKDAQNSEFSGVGLQVSRHPKGLRVDAVYDGSPAKRAGLRQGDVIVAADGHDLAGLSQQASVDRVKGPPGSQVRLTWVRGGKRYTKTVSRSTVTVPVVASQLRSSGGCHVGVVRLSQFSSGAHAEVYAALRKLQKRGAKVFVLDLRDNGGGLVSEAQLIASAFLKDGPIVTTRGRAVKEQTLRARERRHCLGLRDRHRRAAGPRSRDDRRHRDLRQGRLPGGPRALQRRRAGHHRRPVLHAQGPQPRRQGRLHRQGDHPRRPGQG